MKFEKTELNAKNVLKFLIPAIIGIILFLVPFKTKDSTGMLVGIILTKVGKLCSGFSYYLVTALMVLVSLATIYVKIAKPEGLKKHEHLWKIFNPGTFELILRFLGTVLAVLTLCGIGPNWLIGDDTGYTMLDLSANIMVWFIVASFFVPFLLDFGLMEFIGTLTSKIAKPLLKIPGRSMIDVLTSFVGDQNLGIMLTNDQYIHGYYTGKEAAIISTCFSATGIAYWYIISTILNVDAFFSKIVITMFAANFLATIIMCRIPPLSKVDNTYYKGVDNSMEGLKPEGMSDFQYAVQLAVQKAQSFKGGKAMAKRSVNFSMDVVFSVVPIVMAIGSIGLILATYTPLFDWIGLPFKYYLQLLKVPEAAAAAPATVAGFADVMIPSLIAADIASVRTRFIICVLSLSQIIYMSEVGPILMMSDIPLKIGKIIGVFIVKTVIALPIICAFAALLGVPV